MAGDWIKMRGNLWDDPRVARLCDLTDHSEAPIIGALYWLWATADQHTESGILPGLTIRQIDRKTGVQGFGDALCTIGWLADHPEGVRVVRFHEHNGASAKRRASEAQRKANIRSVSAQHADTARTECGTTADAEQTARGRHAELEIEIEKKEEHPPSPRRRGADAARFEEFWQAWPRNERKQDKAKCVEHWKRNALDQHADAILADVRTKRRTKKWSDGFIEAPLVYLRGKRWADGVVPEAEGGAEIVDWRSSSTGIRQKGIELGLCDWDEDAFQHGRGEHFPAYRARVERAVKEQETGPADPAGMQRVGDMLAGLCK